MLVENKNSQIESEKAHIKHISLAEHRDEAFFIAQQEMLKIVEKIFVFYFKYLKKVFKLK